MTQKDFCFKLSYHNKCVYFIIIIESVNFIPIFLVCLTRLLIVHNILNHHGAYISAWDFPPIAFRR
jgi:hypothetical protein